ncbi:hypothetical protein NDA13_005009 [Ustilago tritici]|nr:hypothetical protein NDA13_005009 [Ustilago tritici]
MKLSGMFQIGFVAAIVTALILLPSCIAPGNADRAGTSTSQPNPHSGLTEPQRPAFDVRSYIESLNAEPIAGLDQSQAKAYDKQIRASNIDIEPPRAADIEYLPHADDKPILTQGSEGFGLMARVAHTDPRKFYYVQRGMEPILVDPHTEELFSNPDVSEQQKIQRALTGYRAAKQDYDQTIASVIWGRPIKASADPEGGRASHIPLTEYPWLTYGATRDNMGTTSNMRFSRHATKLVLLLVAFAAAASVLVLPNSANDIHNSDRGAKLVRRQGQRWSW